MNEVGGSSAHTLTQWCVLLLLTFPAPVSARQVEGGPRPEVSAYLVVLAGRLNVRAAPSLDADVLAVAARGETLCVLRYEDDWAEVRTPLDERGRAASINGFVSRGFVSETRATREELARRGCSGGAP